MIHPHGVFAAGAFTFFAHWYVRLYKECQSSAAGGGKRQPATNDTLWKVYGLTSDVDRDNLADGELIQPSDVKRPYIKWLAAPFLTILGSSVAAMAQAFGAQLVPATRNAFNDPAQTNGDLGIIGLVPGGFHEVRLVKSEKEAVWMKARKGIIKHGLRRGLKLVPIYTIGERDAYSIFEIESLRWLNDYDIPNVVPWSWWFPAPNKVPLKIVCGAGLQLPRMEGRTSTR